jgi:DNA end-binding protein Ku
MARKPRSLWNGTITVGVIVVPVKLYTAVESKTVRFREVHLADEAKVEHRRFCSAEDHEVPYEEVVRGFEIAEGEYVVLDKEEVAAAAGDRAHVIALEQFVEAARIDPVFYAKTYYLGAGDDGGDAYRLLHDALGATERAGLGRFTFHDREYLVALRALGDVMALHTLRFADEVVGGDELEIGKGGRKPSSKEVDMAGKLVDSLHEDFEPEAYEDTYREAVLDLIRRKAKGEEIDLAEQEEPEHGDDLSAALEASLGAGR